MLLNKYSQFSTFRHNLTSQGTETLSNTVMRTSNIIRGKIILNDELENMLKKCLLFVVQRDWEEP